MPRIVFSVVDLPEALPPSRQTSSPSPDGEVHPLQDVDLAVVGVDGLELEQRRDGVHFVAAAFVPRYASTTRGSVATASNVPSAILIAVVERDDAVRDALDDVHVVLDHEDRVAALRAQLRDQLRDLVRLVRVHPGGGLVEQEHARLRSPSRARSRAGAGSRTRASRRAGSSGSPSAAARRTTSFSSASAAISRSSRRIPGVRRIERTTPARVGPYAAAITFSFTVMFRNSRSVWNVRATPRCVILCGEQADERLRPSSRMSPAIGLVDAGDQVEERRLAGAVRPDHADDLALVDVQVEVVDHLQAAERHRDPRQLEQPAHTISTLDVRAAPAAAAHQHDEQGAEEEEPGHVGSTTSRFSQTKAAR